MQQRTKIRVLWVVFALMVTLLAGELLRRDNGQVSYGTFLHQVRSGQVATVVFRGNLVEAVGDDGRRFVVYNPETDYSALIGLLQRSGVKITAESPKQQSLLVPMLLSGLSLLLPASLAVFACIGAVILIRNLKPPAR